MPDNNSLKICLTDLAKAFDLVAQHIRKTQGDVIELDEDYYWDMDESQLYDPNKEPASFSLGQLSHDVERLEQIVSGEAPAIGNSMAWLGSVLRAVGQKVIA
jgi:hypothetical protein